MLCQKNPLHPGIVWNFHNWRTPMIECVRRHPGIVWFRRVGE